MTGEQGAKERARREVRFTLDSERDTDRLGEALAEGVRAGLVIGLVGPLGAGKTRLVRGVAQALGVDPCAVVSPTFGLIHEYQGRLPIYHFDVYRLGGAAELEDLGAAEYFEGDGLCLVEWADRVASLLPADAWWITLEPAGPSTRLACLTLPASERIPILPDLNREISRPN